MVALSKGEPSKRVLVVDDNHDVAEALSMGLERLGYAVHTAFDGLSGLEAAVAFRPRVVMIDLALPLMDGWQLARRLRDTPLFKQPRLIAISGLSDPVHKAESLAAGFEHHLVKPVRIGQLEQILDG